MTMTTTHQKNPPLHRETDAGRISKFREPSGIECPSDGCAGLLSLEDEVEMMDEAVLAMCSECHGYYELQVEISVDYYDPQPLAEDEL